MPLEQLQRERAAASSGTADLLAEDARLEQEWATARSGQALTEAAAIAPGLAMTRIFEWSVRLRNAGRAEECPLIAVSNNDARPLIDRAIAAASAWSQAKDPRAATAISELVDRLGALERQAVQQLAPDLVDPLPPYFLHARPEILERIPLNATSLLELGCAAGILGQTVKARQKCRYVGVELDPAVARIAANGLDQVSVLDLDVSELPFDPGTFDCVICADVLEHLKDPWAVLAQIFGLLRPGGHIVVSIPNIRNLAVMAELAAGDWVYQDAGILDRTHLRFFTLRSFGRALLGAGFELAPVNCVFDPALQATASSSGQGLQAKYGQLQIDGLSPQDAMELATIQFLFVASRPATEQDQLRMTALGAPAAAPDAR